MNASQTLELIVYAFALWLGLYLLARNPRKALLRFAGCGLVAYAFSLAGDVIGAYAPNDSAALITRAHRLLLFLPAICWAGALPLLLPENTPLRAALTRLWRYGLLPTAALFSLLSMTSDLVLRERSSAPHVGPLYSIFALAVLAPLVGGLAAIIYTYRNAPPRRRLSLILAVTAMLGLSTSLVLFPLDWLPRIWFVLLVGIDLILLDVIIVVFDAFDEGETLLPDISRSFLAASMTALLFGGQVALAMTLGTGPTFATLALLLAVVASAISFQVFLLPFQEALDRIAFAGMPWLRQARSELRTAVEVLPRLDLGIDPVQIDEAEFARLTRRVLSHYGDMSRLATNPLTRMPLVEARLARRGAVDDHLERAAELKALLTESIARLKPRGKGDFGTSDEWRYYNALYFPYVVGLRPYSRRTNESDLDPVARQALAWFQTAVPERTLYNWQTVAAKLVAQDLRTGLMRADNARGSS